MGVVLGLLVAGLAGGWGDGGAKGVETLLLQGVGLVVGLMGGTGEGRDINQVGERAWPRMLPGPPLWPRHAGCSWPLP